MRVLLRKPLLANFNTFFLCQVLKRMTWFVNVYSLKKSHLYALTFPSFFAWSRLTDDKICSNYWGDSCIASLITKADDLNSNGRHLEVYELLNRIKYNNNAEVLWRVSRALYKLSLDKSLSSTIRENIINEAYDIIKQALKINEYCANAHKWMAIVYDAKCGLNGTLARLENAETIKTHLLKCVELNPLDSTAFYILGKWCYDISNLTWFERQIATYLYTSLPVTSYEEAYEYFQHAEDINPRFYIGNLVMLGKTCLKLGKFHHARFYLHTAASLPVYNSEDKAYVAEARKLSHKLKAYDLEHDAL